MKSRFWKRVSASLLVGALAAVAWSPLATQAAPPAAATGSLPQGQPFGLFGGLGSCLALGSGGLTGVGAPLGAVGHTYTFGAGGFHNPYYQPAYSSYGLGTIGGFLNYTGGQPSPFALLAGSPLCTGFPIPRVATTQGGGPALLQDFRVPHFGGSFGATPFLPGGFGTFGLTGTGVGTPVSGAGVLFR